MNRPPLDRCTDGLPLPPVDDLDSVGPFVIRCVYALPRDGTDRRLGEDGTISRSLSAMQAWFAAQTGVRLRFADEPVRTVRLPETDARIADRGSYVRDRIERLLRRQGFHEPRTLYAVWYDGSSTFSCGGGAWPPELRGRVAALYLQGAYDDVVCAEDRFSPDGVTPEINEFKMLHEILHTMGFVAPGSPHHTQAGHLGNNHNDLMYAGDPPWNPSVIDPYHQDYFRTGRTDIPDLARSSFLDPLPAGAEPPPLW